MGHHQGIRPCPQHIDPHHLSGTGPCATLNAKTGTLDPKHEAYLRGIVAHYFAIITAVCAKYPTCGTDHGASQQMPVAKSDLSVGLDHLSVTGDRTLAALAWHAFYR